MVGWGVMSFGIFFPKPLEKKASSGQHISGMVREEIG